jgi:hypothetical protein
MGGTVILLVVLAASATERVDRGRLSVYWPGDPTGTSRVLACDSPRRRLLYRRGSVHVARRDWRRIGCGTVVRVCAEATGRCADAPVLDSGPWGIVRGPLKNAVRDGRWRRPRGPREASRWLRRLPPGWRFRGVVDLSRELWRRLGRPPSLSFVRVHVPRGR